MGKRRERYVVLGVSLTLCVGLLLLTPLGARAQAWLRYTQMDYPAHVDAIQFLTSSECNPCAIDATHSLTIHGPIHTPSGPAAGPVTVRFGSEAPVATFSGRPGNFGITIEPLSCTTPNLGMTPCVMLLLYNPAISSSGTLCSVQQPRPAGYVGVFSPAWGIDSPCPVDLTLRRP